MASDWLMAACALAALCLPLAVAWWLAGRGSPRARSRLKPSAGRPVVRSFTPLAGGRAERRSRPPQPTTRP